MKALRSVALFTLVCFSQTIFAQSLSQIHQIKPTRHVSQSGPACAPPGVRLTGTGIELTTRDGSIISGEFDSSGRITKFRIGNITSEIAMGADGKPRSMHFSDGKVIAFDKRPITVESRQRFKRQVRAVAKDNSCATPVASGEFAARPAVHSIVKTPFESSRIQGKFGFLKIFLTDEEESESESDMMDPNMWEDYFTNDWWGEMGAYAVPGIPNPSPSCQIAYDSCMSELTTLAATAVTVCGAAALLTSKNWVGAAILGACIGGGYAAFNHWSGVCAAQPECRK